MKKSRILCFWTVAAIFLSAVCLIAFSADDAVIADSPGESLVLLYTADGRCIKIPSSETDAYKAVGWYDYEDVTTTLYSTDGRKLTIFNNDIEKYKAVGWYYYEDATSIIYAPDGRTARVYKDEINTYLSLGWFKNYSDVVTELYSADGRTLTVYNAEVEIYLGLGWYRTRPAQKLVALTFDDGPSRYTKEILDSLEKHGAKATFFVLGQLADSYPDIIKRAVSLGCEIGNHSYDHKSLNKLNENGIRSELTRTADKIESITGIRTGLVRPPYGAYNSTVINTAGNPIILWSIDTLDWKTRNAATTVNKIIDNVRDGDIILMHDIYSQSAEAAVTVIPKLIEKGYSLVTVSELITAKQGEKVNGRVYSRIQ